MKKAIILFITLLLTLSIGFSAEFYTKYQFSFPNEKPTSMFIKGGECVDSQCSAFTGAVVSLYDGNLSTTCINNYVNTGNYNNFLTCMNSAKINGNIVDLTKVKSVMTKVTIPSTFGHLTIFSPSNDSYIPMYFRSTSYNCQFSICYDNVPKTIKFYKKSNAIAKINQLNIVNVNNKLKPIQVTVPVKINQTICSAFQKTNPNMFYPQVPKGYSDYSIDTQIILNITLLNYCKNK